MNIKNLVLVLVLLSYQTKGQFSFHSIDSIYYSYFNGMDTSNIRTFQKTIFESPSTIRIHEKNNSSNQWYSKFKYILSAENKQLNVDFFNLLNEDSSSTLKKTYLFNDKNQLIKINWHRPEGNQSVCYCYQDFFYTNNKLTKITCNELRAVMQKTYEINYSSGDGIDTLNCIVYDPSGYGQKEIQKYWIIKPLQAPNQRIVKQKLNIPNTFDQLKFRNEFLCYDTLGVYDLDKGKFTSYKQSLVSNFNEEKNMYYNLSFSLDSNGKSINAFNNIKTDYFINNTEEFDSKWLTLLLENEYSFDVILKWYLDSF